MKCGLRPTRLVTVAVLSTSANAICFILRCWFRTELVSQSSGPGVNCQANMTVQGISAPIGHLMPFVIYEHTNLERTLPVYLFSSLYIHIFCPFKVFFLQGIFLTLSCSIAAWAGKKPKQNIELNCGRAGHCMMVNAALCSSGLLSMQAFQKLPYS